MRQLFDTYVGLLGYRIVSFTNWDKFLALGLPDNTYLSTILELIKAGSDLDTLLDPILGGTNVGYLIGQFGEQALNIVDSFTGVKTKPNDCTEEEMNNRIGTQTVAQVVGVTNYYPGQEHVDRSHVIRLAVSMCQTGFDPSAAIQWIKGATRNTIFDGHTRFVASFVARVLPIFKPEPERDYSRAGIDWPMTREWMEVEWGL
jgi:hypothetical protein